MAVIKPFRALRPPADFARAVASRPYDVLSSAEARAEASGNPRSFYHISKAEIDLAESEDPHGPAVYDKAAENLRQFMREGILKLEDQECYYIYELTMDGKSQTGLGALSWLRDYEQDKIRKHEQTRPDKELDRVNHIRSTGAQTGNVFLAMPDLEELSTLMEQWKDSHLPEYDFEAPDGIGHRLWVIGDQTTIARITELFAEKVPHTYIADGHHRAASAFRVLKDIESKGGLKGPDDPATYFLTTIFPASQLRILDYNRLVRDLNGLGRDSFLSRLYAQFNLRKTGKEPCRPQKPHEFGMYLEGSWYCLQAHEGIWQQNPIGELDITILHDQILEPILEIGDARTDPRVEFMGGIRGLDALAQRVDRGEMKIAFALYPVTIPQLFAVADTGQIMPPKSTWFEPKLRDGLLTYLIR